MARTPEQEIERLKREVSLQRPVEAAGIEPKRHGKDYLGLCRQLKGRELTAIRDATNKAWVLGDDRFKAQIEVKTGRRSVPLGRGGDRKSARYRETKNQ